MTRHVIQTAVTVSTALLLAACAVPNDTTTEPDIGQAEEKADEHVLPLPHTETLDFYSVKHVGPFDLPRGATLTVSISVRWDRPAACPKKPFFLEPARKRLAFGYTDTLEPRPVMADGSTHVERWTALDGGRYLVDVDQQRQDPNCHIVGKITVSSP